MKIVECESDKGAVLAPRWDGFLEDRVRPLLFQDFRFFANKRILITGAGGYLGSALARTLARAAAGRLVLLDIAEYGLYRLDQYLRRATAPPHSVVVGSVCDKALLRELFCRYEPQIVFHAGALKHVPLMETNEFAAAETNVLGTRTLLDTISEQQVENFVLLSTDKAVEPISVMGATKRIAEQIVLSARDRNKGIVSAVRLCNVLGSTGSVAPLFERQIVQGGPVTVTHPEATRYFLSRTDAVRILLRAAMIPTTTGLTVPNVSEPSRVTDLAKFMIERKRSGTGPVELAYTGLRAADKLHEQLMAPSETIEMEREIAGTLTVRSSFNRTELPRALSEIEAACTGRDSPRLMRAMVCAVPDFGRAHACPETRRQQRA